MIIHLERSWRLAPSSLALLLMVLVGSPVALGEMRKSWQAKSVDAQTQLLKAARLDEPPSAKPPEPMVEMEASTAPSEPTTTDGAAGGAPEAVLPKSAQFSSRVRNRYGVVKAGAPSQPIDAEPATQVERDRAVPLHLEHNPGEIQVDDATVQDDDEDGNEEDDDEEDVLGWDEAVKHGKEFDLIENILEEVEGRVQQEKRPNVESPQGAAPSERDTEASDATERKPEERVKDYTFPPVLNMTIDEPNNIVRVKLNQDVVREMLTTGRQGGGLGGKKMLRYILPLFILPFLIQSAVIPFMLTAVKLFLLKSLMAGKLAIFLLLLGAFKNFTKKERDVYVKDVPDRRYEPSSEGFAYLAEGRPSNWVN